MQMRSQVQQNPLQRQNLVFAGQNQPREDANQSILDAHLFIHDDGRIAQPGQEPTNGKNMSASSLKSNVQHLFVTSIGLLHRQQCNSGMWHQQHARTGFRREIVLTQLPCP